MAQPITVEHPGPRRAAINGIPDQKHQRPPNELSDRAVIRLYGVDVDGRVEWQTQREIVLPARGHVRQQDCPGVHRYFLSYLDRDDHSAIVVAAHDVPGSHLGATAGDGALDFDHLDTTGDDRASAVTGND